MESSQILIIDAIIKQLNFIYKNSNVIINHYENREINTIQLFWLTMLKRLNESSFSLTYLFEILKQNQKIEFSIGVQCRVPIADSLISMDLFRIITSLENEGNEKIEAELKKVCDIYLSDGLQHTVTYYNDNKEFNFKTKEETDLAYKSLVNKFKSFFEHYNAGGTVPKLKLQNKDIKNVTNVKDIFKRLANSENTKSTASIYESYAYFSKYDHFGIMYLDFAKNDLDMKLNIYDKSVEIFSMHFNFILTLFKKYTSEDEIITKIYKEAEAYFVGPLRTKYPNFDELKQ